MNNVLSLPKRIKLLTFDELMKESNLVLEGLKNNTLQNPERRITEMMQEFSARLEKESESLKESVESLKNKVLDEK